MFFNAISTFQFNTETVQSHALNIKKLSEWISIEECHLGLSHCRELTAIAFGFKTAEDLKIALKESELSTLSVSPTIRSDLASAIQKFSKPIPFMSMKDEDIKDHYAELITAFCKDEEKRDSDLVKCQKFWGDWHVRFADFISKYFEETHGRFEWFNNLELINENCACKNMPVVRYGDFSDYTFLNLAIYNHLYTQYTGDYGNYIQGGKQVLYDEHVKVRVYVISSVLLDYIKDNWENIYFLKENTYDAEQPKILEYNPDSKQAKLNVFFCKKGFRLSFYCPTNYKSYDFGIAQAQYKSFLFNTTSYDKNYSFILPFQERSNFMNQLELHDGIEFTENDFVGAEVSKSFAIQKILENHSHKYISEGQFSDQIFDLKWDRKECFDVTPNSFKLNETFTVDYLFRKALRKPEYQEIDDRIERLEPVLELMVKSRVYATVEFCMNDGKLGIKLSDVKTKLSRFGRTIPVETAFYTRNVVTDRIYGYSNEGMKFMISVLENRSSFKKMLDAQLYIGPYKQFMLKHLVADIYRSHQKEILLAL